MISSFFLTREIKRYPFFFLLLFITLFLGSLGLMGIGLVSEQVKNKLKDNAKELLTSDLVVSARRDLTKDEKGSLFQTLNGLSFDYYKVIDIYSMVTNLKSGETRLAEIRGIESHFPFYGKMTSLSGPYKNDSLAVSKDLSDIWQVSPQDEIKLGDLTLKINTIIISDSSQGLRGFSLAPRVYLPLFMLEKSGLLKPGATGGFAHHFKFPKLDGSGIEKIKEELTKALPDAGIKITLPEESSEQTGRTLSYLTDFMALAALIGLILSLVGVFYLYQSHLTVRLKDICLLHLYGLTKGRILLKIVEQFSLVFLCSVLIELLVLPLLYRRMVPLLYSTIGIDLPLDLNLKNFFVQLPFLYVLALLVLAPLLMGLLRTPMGPQLKSQKISLGEFRFYDFIPFLLSLWGYSSYLSHSFVTGSLFFFALGVVFVLSIGIIRLLQLFLRKLILGKGLIQPTIEYGIALRNLTRSGNKLTLSFLSIALGSTLISLILQLDRMIQNEFILDENKPSLFIFDIQEEQLPPFLEFTKTKDLELTGVTPMIRARMEKVNGMEFKRSVVESGTLRTREDETESRFKNRGLNLTFRKDLSHAEKIVQGSPFPETIEDPNRPAFLSLEKRFAQRIGLKLGDKVSFDVQGVGFEGVVRNFREVKWTSFYPNFFVNVEPGFIDEAPKTYLAVLPVTTREKKLNFQRDAVKEFYNISFIDIEELAQKLSALFTKSRMAIEVISWLSLGVGLVILYGLSHDQVYRRTYDLALMKSMGFSSGSLIKYLLLEFGSLFLVAMVSGLVLGWAMALVIGQEIFKMGLSIDWVRMLAPGLLLMILCLATVLFSSWKVVRTHPRELLSDS